LVLLRQEIGDVLRNHRLEQGQTLRLDVPLAQLLREVSDRLALVEGVYAEKTYIPDTVPDAFVTEAELYSH
jgi:hypothetical protein